MTVQISSADSVEWLYRNHYGGLLAWLQRKLGSASHAADLAQDTFVRMLARGPAIRPGMVDLREPAAYLRAIANGLVIDHWRRQTLEQAYLEALALQPEARAPSPEDRAIILEALEQIARLLDTLKPRMRTAFLLSQIEGLGYAEIARQMGVSVRTIERYMAEALYRCHRALNDGTAAAARPGRSQP